MILPIVDETAYVDLLTEIEDGVHIAEMACVGTRGMTLQWDDKKHISWRRTDTENKYPVILKKGVYVGARTTIMRGTKWNTVIGEGTFIGPNVCIGHDNKIGKHCCILSGTITCGSVTIGDYAYIAPGVLIKDNVTIGKYVKIGIGSLVLKDVPDGLTMVGRPAKTIENVREFQQILRRISSL